MGHLNCRPFDELLLFLLFDIIYSLQILHNIIFPCRIFRNKKKNSFISSYNYDASSLYREFSVVKGIYSIAAYSNQIN